MRAFAFAEPVSLEEAVALLSEHQADDWQVLAGGTDVVVQMQQGRLRPGGLVSVRRIPDLRGIEFLQDGTTRIGAMTTVRELELSAELRSRYPIIGDVVRRFGGLTIRNMATVGGNICRANPSGDLPPVLIVLGATATIFGPTGSRVVPVEDLILGNRRTVLARDEILVRIDIPPLDRRYRSAYYKQAPRFVDLSTLGLAVIIDADPERNCRDLGYVVGGAGPAPLRMKRVEDYLRGRKLDSETLAQAGCLAADDCRPRVDSVRATPEFRRRLLRVLTGRVISMALEGR